MIARTWHGAVPEEKSDTYYKYLLRTGVPDCQATEGNCGVYVFRTSSKGETHFMFITLWDSYDAIQKFAGNDIEQARYYPEDEDYLIELEPHVTHYEVLVAPEQNKL